MRGTKVLVANLDGKFCAIGSVYAPVGGPLEKETLSDTNQLELVDLFKRGLTLQPIHL